MAQPKTQLRRGSAALCALALVASVLFILCGNDELPSLSPSPSSGGSTRDLITKDASPSRTEHERGVIFYNVYVPPSDTEPDNYEAALAIVEEQMALVGASNYARDTPIRYGLIGDESATDRIEESCGGRRGNSRRREDCTRIAYEERGNEWVTLQPLYEYCRAHPSKWVTYMHNKGSFHPSTDNDVMRRMITKAVLSDECQTVSAEQCNVCSNRFTPLPFLHTSGNHWTASCEYVSDLIPPMYFFPAMEELLDDSVEHVLSWVNDGKGWRDLVNPSGAQHLHDEEKEKAEEKASLIRVKRHLAPEPTHGISPTFTGRGRFAMEHWVHSHPRAKPCDVYPGKYAWGHTDLPSPPGDEWTPELRTTTVAGERDSAAAPPPSSFPRFETLERFVIPPFSAAVSDPWYCGIESRLFEFDKLYGEEPPRDSWIWSFYEASENYCRCQREERQR